MLLVLAALQAKAQNTFPNGIFVSKGNNGAGSGLFSGTTYTSHFHYSDAEDTYIRGGKATSNVIIGDVGVHVYLGNASGPVYAIGDLFAQKSATVANGIYAAKGSNAGGSAIFVGTQFASHFHYAANEDTYLRGGKTSSNIYIADVNNNVVIGSVPAQPAGYRLFVDKGILTEKVKVAVKTSGDWSDHVFNEQYPLMPISQLEQFIKTNKHLPGIPSANDMIKNGNDLGQTDARLLEKIEELTLHLIELNKRMGHLENENRQLKEIISATQKKGGNR